ncbi:Do family serine endopeptidase [Planctomyces sp. SH-PL14]|uniref:Do family serine endopeptidase n=1 Tax=Planctomyces sp. SH-PL14 TaxID=1632864 RepID=UPI00078B8BC3|nr:Do family serine endopeptidase [Planctomyces sp. SH-PL14]AMV17201.1 putative periplasmic serine endoprotease DegP-like precursor [Planctomyces sp. SH-PL14]
MVKHNLGWVSGLSLGICLGAGAIALSEAKGPPTSPEVAFKGEVLPPVSRSPQTAQNMNMNFREVSDKVLPAVVSIETSTKARVMPAREGVQFEGNEEMLEQFFGGNPQMREMFRQGGPQRRMPAQRGAGSGFIIDADGIVMTNSHVVDGADSVTVHLQDGRVIKAESWINDPRSDVAIVRLAPTGSPLPALKMGDSDTALVGDWCLAVGNPFDIGTTVTAGIISARGRAPSINEREDFIQTDAAINPGNSGGPLVNLNGEVIGINTAISTRSGGYDGVGFAIPGNMARWVAEQLIKDGSVRRAYLGVALQPMTPNLRQSFGVGPNEGALIGEVMPKSPGEKSGLQSGDVILEFAGRKIANQTELQGVVEQCEPGKGYQATVLRDGDKKPMVVKVEQMPSDYTPALAKMAKPVPAEATQNGKLGLSVVALDNEIAEQLGLEGDAHGVVVRNVRGDGPAAAAGLRQGDVVLKVQGQSVSSVEDFQKALDSGSLDKGVRLHVKRGKSAFFTILQNAE